MATKAARGAGFPPAQAARFGPAAAHHLTAQRDAKALMQALREAPDGVITAYPLALDAGLAEAALGGDAVLEGLRLTPLLDSYVAQLPFAASLDVVAGQVHLRVDFERSGQARRHGRVTGHAAVMSEFERLAALTYVPENAQSRRTGAGADVSDNE